MRARLALATVALTVAAVVGTNTLAEASPPEPYDHLKCFKIRDSLTDRRTIYLADIYPNAPFGMRKDCRLRLPALHFCVNVNKSNVLVNGEPFATLPVPSAESARDYLCYDLKCDRDRLEVDALDQFGARTLRTRKSDFLCMPASKVTVSPSPTMTPTPDPSPTSTPQLEPCRLVERGVGVCGGDCDPGYQCAWTGDNARQTGDDCACVHEDTLCGVRPLGTGGQLGFCGGFCPSPGASCEDVSTLTEPDSRALSNCQCVLL